MLPYDLIDSLNDYTPWKGPTLHGPLPQRHLPGPSGDRSVERGTHGPLTIDPRFDWVLVDGAWERDWSAYVPYRYPKPIRGPNGA